MGCNCATMSPGPSSSRRSPSTAPGSSSGTKLILLGGQTVGKTSIITQLCDKKFPTQYASTVGSSLTAKRIQIPGYGKQRVELWDTSGQERFRSLLSVYYHDTDVILFVYDVTNSDSFTDIRTWIETVQNNTRATDFHLVANKKDLQDQRVIDREQGEALAKEFDIHYHELSAKSYKEVKFLFQSIAEHPLSLI